MAARQRSASSLSHNTAASNTSSPGGFVSNSGTGPGVGAGSGTGKGTASYLHDPDSLMLSAAEIPSFHGDLGGPYGGDGSYPTMTATYIPSGMPPTSMSGTSRPRAHTSASIDSNASGAAFAGLQPRQPSSRNSMLSNGNGVRHISTSQLEASGRLGNGVVGAAGPNSGGHYSNSTIPPPPPHPHAASSLPAHALNQREYQPHYAHRPEYRSVSSSTSSVNYHYSPGAHSYHSQQTILHPTPPPQASGYHQYPPPPQPSNHYNSQRPSADMYRHPSAQSSESLSSFSRHESASETDFSTPANSVGSGAGGRSAPQSASAAGLARSAHAQSPLASPNSLPIAVDVAVVWTLDRVLSYLDRHHFPSEWLQAFKNLNIYGVEFLELAQNQGLLTHVLPEVMRVYPNADESKERVAARNIKKMIRDILRLAHYAEDAPELHSSSPATRQQVRRPSGNVRSSTMPVYPDSGINASVSSEHLIGKGVNEPHHRSSGSDPALRGRDDFSKTALNAADTARYSPSSSQINIRDPTSGLTRPSLGGSSQGSPNPAYQAPIRHGHSNSTESATASRSGDGKTDKKALLMLGLLPRGDKADSPHEKGSNRQDSLDYQKHGGGKILEKVRKKFWPKEAESNEEESPTSPGFKHTLSNLPFAIAENNDSNSSVDKLSVSSVDATRHRASFVQVPTRGKPTYIFVTRDGRVWVLVELPHTDNGDSLRKEICSNLRINDWSTASIHLTEIGQKPQGKQSTDIAVVLVMIDRLMVSAADEELTDAGLLNTCHAKADSVASLKLFVRLPNSSAGIDTSGSSFFLDKEILTSPLKGDFLGDLRPLFADGRPTQPAHPAQSEFAISTLKQSAPDSNQEGIEKETEADRTSPPLSAIPKDDDFDVLRERLAVLRSYQESGSNPKINVIQPYSTTMQSNPPSAAQGSMQSSPHDPRTDQDQEYQSYASTEWEDYSNSSTLKPEDRKELSDVSSTDGGISPAGRSSELFFDEDKSSSTAFGTYNKASAGTHALGAAARQKVDGASPAQQRPAEQSFKRSTKPPDLDKGFQKVRPERPPRMVDFDNPRPSPYEDRKMEDLIPHLQLVPHREPPPPPVNRQSSGSWSRAQAQMASRSLQRKHSVAKPMVQIRGQKHHPNPMRGSDSGGMSMTGGIGSSLVSAGVLSAGITRTPLPGYRKEVPPSVGRSDQSAYGFRSGKCQVSFSLVKIGISPLNFEITDCE
jgi:hypothetical protein